MDTQAIRLFDFMDRPEGWGRRQGREVFQRLLEFVEENAATAVFRISVKDVQRMDISFASEAIIELARRFRRTKGFCLIDLMDTDLLENVDAACWKKNQPMIVVMPRSVDLLGTKPSQGTREAFEFAMSRQRVRATEFAAHKGIPVANSSMKYKQLWEQGFLLRCESTADSGGVEYVYYRIG